MLLGGAAKPKAPHANQGDRVVGTLNCGNFASWHAWNGGECTQNGWPPVLLVIELKVSATKTDHGNTNQADRVALILIESNVSAGSTSKGALFENQIAAPRWHQDESGRHQDGIRVTPR